MKVLKTVAATVALLAVSGCAADVAEGDRSAPAGKADSLEPGTFNALPGAQRYIVLAELDRVVPVYLEQTLAVLEKIDSLPQGTVSEGTMLDEIPIDDLFADGQAALGEVMVDVSFDQGRREHDIDWLRNSANGLIELEEILDEARPTLQHQGIDAHLTNTSFFQSETSEAYEVSVGLVAVSRFFCNLDVRIVNDPGGVGFFVETSEHCD